MFLKNTGQQNYIDIINYAVVHSSWIAAFFVSTGFSPFQHAPPGTLFEYALLCALIFGWVRFFVPNTGERQFEILPRCRSPPSDFDFAYPNKNRNSEVHYERNKSAGVLPVLYK